MLSTERIEEILKILADSYYDLSNFIVFDSENLLIENSIDRMFSYNNSFRGVDFVIVTRNFSDINLEHRFLREIFIKIFEVDSFQISQTTDVVNKFSGYDWSINPKKAKTVIRAKFHYFSVRNPESFDSQALRILQYYTLKICSLLDFPVNTQGIYSHHFYNYIIHLFDSGAFGYRNIIDNFIHSGMAKLLQSLENKKYFSNFLRMSVLEELCTSITTIFHDKYTLLEILENIFEYNSTEISELMINKYQEIKKRL